MGARAFNFPITCPKDAEALRRWAKNVEKDSDTDWSINPIVTVKYEGEQYALVNTDGSGCVQYLTDYGYKNKNFTHYEDEWITKINHMRKYGKWVVGIKYIKD